MRRLRQLGFETYDFGGCYGGMTDEEKLKINAFRKSFAEISRASLKRTTASLSKARRLSSWDAWPALFEAKSKIMSRTAA
jgi:hypothetical protein